MSKPHILVARAIFPETLARLAQHFEVEANPDDTIWTKAQLIEHLQDKVGAFTTGSERIDAEVLAACPQLRIVANMAVGYNNFDVDAMTAAGVLGTNAPDVLTETTADFGFALLMATARRVTESEHFLRAGIVDQVELRHVRRRGGARQHAGHPGHGPHRPGHCQARGARLRHEGDLSQPLAPFTRAGSRVQSALCRQGGVAAHRRPPGAGGAVLRGIASRDWRGRAGADEAHRYAWSTSRAAASWTTRRWPWPCARNALRRRAWMCSRASPRCTPTC
jgi:hypothetical protein